MKNTHPLRNQIGITIFEIVISMALISVFIYSSMSMFQSLNGGLVRSRTTSTRDRLLAGIRNVAGMPATLRSSARASNEDGSPVNLALYNCVGSATPNLCKHNQDHPMTLYSPFVLMDAAGVPTGLKPIGTPKGVANSNLHLDSFGVACETPGPNCPFTIYTSFRAQCPPPLLPTTPVSTTDPFYVTYFEPKSDCTIAEVIEVMFTVQVDQALIDAYPELAPYSTPFHGSVTTRAKPVFGNDPR